MQGYPLQFAGYARNGKPGDGEKLLGAVADIYVQHGLASGKLPVIQDLNRIEFPGPDHVLDRQNGGHQEAKGRNAECGYIHFLTTPFKKENGPGRRPSSQ